MQSTKQAQAITNRFLPSEGPRPEQMLPDFPEERDSRVLTLYGFDKQDENRCWGWNIRNGGRYTEKCLRYDGVTQLECFFEEDGRGNMKGSRFLWRQVGFSRRSRIFPRNPTPGNDFPTTLEMGRVPRRPGPFWGFKCSQSQFSFILMNKLCLCWHHD